MTTKPLRPFARYSRKALLFGGVCALSLGLLQPVAAQDDPNAPNAGLPDSQPVAAATDTAKPYTSVANALSDSDRQLLGSALQYVRTRNFAQADSLGRTLANPVARKIVTWSIINNDGASIYSFASLDAARRDLWGWPREAKRQIAAEKMIALSGMTAQQTVDWFNGAPPQSVEGASALIAAYGNLARTDDATQLA
ncbi:MAG: lytic transglycosylase domain-containing protein, partial [Asticcacaulis sp.]|nr:lytic transglycosylase domain-containing protein [Asticcacaulis sp.]